MSRKDLNDYVLSDGKYVYKGVYYRFALMGRDLTIRKRAHMALSVIEFVAFIAMGVFDNGHSRIFYIALPLVTCAFPACMGCAAAYFTLSMPESMTLLQYKRGPKRTKFCAGMAITTGGMTLIGILVKGLIDFFAIGDLPFTAAALLFTGCGYIASRLCVQCPAKPVS